MKQGNDMISARVAPVDIDGYGAGSLNSSDETLVERVARGDQLAMRALYARHSTRVYRFILRLVRDRAVAEDILSDRSFQGSLASAAPIRGATRPGSRRYHS